MKWLFPFLLTVALCPSIAQTTPGIKQAQSYLDSVKNLVINDELFPYYELDSLIKFRNGWHELKASYYYDCWGDICLHMASGLVTPSGDSIAPVFSRIIPFGNEALIDIPDGYAQINENFRVVDVYDYLGAPYEDFVVASKGGKYGLLDIDGLVAWPFEYDYLESPDEFGTIVIREGEEWRLQQVPSKRGGSKAEFEWTGYEVYFKVRNPETGLWALLDGKLAQITDYLYEEIVLIPDDIAKARYPESYGWGLIDEEGREVTPFEYDNFIQAGKYFIVVKGTIFSRYGLANKDGMIVEPIYHGISEDKYYDDTLGAFFLVKDQYGKTGILGVDGEEKTALKYDEINPWEMTGKIGDAWTAIDLPDKR